MKRILLYISFLLTITACSTTRHLPEGEQLYIGQKPMKLLNQTASSEMDAAMEEVEAALATTPNNSLLGSSSLRIPFPMGLWFYSGFQQYQDQRGFGRFVFDRFAAKPVLLSTVNPDVRVKAASNLLRDYGYFNNRVSYETFTDTRDSLKVKLQYTVDVRNPYRIDTVEYRGFSERTLRLLQLSQRNTLLPKGKQFNITELDAERTRISSMLRNLGCYYFRPDYLTYQADTTLVPGGHVSLRMIPVPGIPEVADKPFNIGKRSVILLDSKGNMPTDSLQYKDYTIYYHNKPLVRPNMLYRWLDYKSYLRKRQTTDSTGLSRRRNLEHLYSFYRQTRVQERLSNVGIFRNVEMHYTPRDTTFTTDTLDMRIIAMLDKPYDAELDFNMKLKSNNQMGPGAAFIVTKNNVFGGGESWNIKINGSYEWQIGKNSSSAMDSYELGVSTALTFPRVVFPRMGDREYDFPATTTFKLYANQLNRAKYYQLLAFGGNVTYDFQPQPAHKHSLTPFRLTFNVLRKPTAEFEELQAQNPALYVSLRNQFIPAMEYSYTYDNSLSRKDRHHTIWWQGTLTSAGNATSLIYKLCGEDFSKQGKQLMGVPYAQFLKLNSEFRYRYRMDRNNTIATRFAAGAIWSYGNTNTAPYTEQFYIGGANSIRAFTIRSIGPGGFPPKEDDKFSFINHVGDIRLEANLEYRFRIISDLHGAVFLDAGNVWLMRKDATRPQGEFTLKNFARQIALGTGVGVRYDMDFLVFRLDLGIGLHNPYDTGKSGYYNIPSFKESMALHFAIGYPF